MTDQAQRHNANKLQLSYLLEAPHAMADLARVLEFGAKKYARGNWKKGRPPLDTIDSLLRHLMAYVNGEDCDPESGLPHTAHVLCNAMFLAEHSHTRPDLDDRNGA